MFFSSYPDLRLNEEMKLCEFRGEVIKDHGAPVQFFRICHSQDPSPAMK